MPLGPLQMVDMLGLTLVRDIFAALEAEGAQVVHGGSRAMAAIARMLEAGRSGRPAGFHDYPDGKPLPWTGLSGLFAPTVAPAAELRDRLAWIQSIETLRAMSEGVIADPAQIEVGATLGWGYPLRWGGPLSFIDSTGLPAFARRADDLAAHGARFALPPDLAALAAQALDRWRGSPA